MGKMHVDNLNSGLIEQILKAQLQEQEDMVGILLLNLLHVYLHNLKCIWLKYFRD